MLHSFKEFKGIVTTILTNSASNLSFERWVEVFGDPTVTSAMIDRLTYKAILVNMEGDSYRLRETLRESGASMNFDKLNI
jgi:DNA replication protein DnaC